VWIVFDTSCPICAASLADWNLAYERVASDSSLVVLGLALDSASATTTYVRERGVAFPVALLDDPLAHARYRFAGVPLTMVIDEVGRIRLVRPGRFTRAAADSLQTYLSARGETAEVVAQR
jgi:peroxiredoxin